MRWLAGSSDGGLPILGYRVRYRLQGSSEYTEESAGGYLSYTVEGLTQGAAYEFTVAAENSAGYSAESDALSLVFASAPDTPQTPTTTIVGGTQVVIDWQAPSDNGSPITSYTVLIKYSQGYTFREDSVSCDGSDSTIIANTQCTVPLSTLTAAPYSLQSGDSVIVLVIASNAIGSSQESNFGNGAIVP